MFHEHPWPGNVRELKNVMHRAWIMADEEIVPKCLPARMRDGTAEHERLSLKVGTSIAEAEKRLILATLESLGGDKKKAAKTLGVSLKTLYNRLNSYEEEGEKIAETD